MSNKNEATHGGIATMKVTQLTIADIVGRMNQGKRQIYQAALDKDPRFMSTIAEAYQRLDIGRQNAQKIALANVATDNSAGIIDAVRPLIVQHPEVRAWLIDHNPSKQFPDPLSFWGRIWQALQLRQTWETSSNHLLDRKENDLIKAWLHVCAQVPDDDVALLGQPGYWVSLESFNRVLEAAYLLDGRPDSVLRLAMHMKRSGSRSVVGEVMLAAQPTGTIDSSVELSPMAVHMFNMTKDIGIVELTKSRATLWSVIHPWITLMNDYPSRYFVGGIMADNLAWVIWEAYLEKVVGINYQSILNKYQRATEHLLIDRRDSSTVIGDIFTEGVWQWWCQQYPSLVEKHKLPMRIRCDFYERCLQFPLYEALRFHQRLAKQIARPTADPGDGILWAHQLDYVWEDGPRLFARVGDTIHQIAHRVKLLSTERDEPEWRDLRPEEPWHNQPYLIDKTIALCHSAEWGERIDVCSFRRRSEEEQLWNMPYTLWRMKWRNPPSKSERPSKVRQLFQLIKNLDQGKRGAVPALVGSVTQLLLRRFRQRRRSLAKISAQYQARYEAMNTKMTNAFEDYLELVATVGNDFEAFQQGFDQLLERMLDPWNRAHIQRLRDICWLFVAWLAKLEPNQFRLLLEDRDKLPDELKRNREFLILVQLVEMLRFIAKIHDTGKFLIEEEILNAGSPGPEGFAILKSHVELGWRMLAALYEKVLWLVQAALFHHENEDGSGYPWGLKSDQIPMAAKVLRLADVWDAMTGDRPYRTPYWCSIADTLGNFLNSMNRGWVHVPLAVWFVRFTKWLRQDLGKLSEEVLLGFGLAEATVTYLQRLASFRAEDYDFAEVPEEKRAAVKAKYMADEEKEPALYQQIEDKYGAQADEWLFNGIDWQQWIIGEALDLDAIMAARKA